MDNFMDPQKAAYMLTSALGEFLNVNEGIIVEWDEDEKYVVYKDVDASSGQLLMYIRHVDEFSLPEENKVHGQIVKVHDYSSN